MLTGADLEAREAALLASYATRSLNSAGREHPEPNSETRTQFQRDRDRVLHTTAFRRLEAKTQVFLNVQGDHYRTRLTHTLEVQQVARSVALSLGLNETLAETIALAHDLGHPPFGHVGEEKLNKLMTEHGGFNHNLQSRRIVSYLENRYFGFLGLNLTFETLDGLNKHHRNGLAQPSLEAQVVDLADAIAYTVHDLDDGLRSRLLTQELLQELRLWQALLKRLGHQKTIFSPLEFRVLYRELLGWLIKDLTYSSDESLRQSGIKTAAEAQEYPHKLIKHSPEMQEMLSEMRGFLIVNLYRHWRVEMQVEQANRVIETLFETFVSRPAMLPPRPKARLERDGLHRTICDHIAGMTDRYAIEIHASITPLSGVERWIK